MPDGRGVGEGKDEFRLVHVWGNAYEMGYWHGRLMADDINQFMPAVYKYLENEEKLGHNILEPLNELENFMKEHKVKIRKLFNGIKKESKIVHGYGASTKCNILLQYCAHSSISS